MKFTFLGTRGSYPTSKKGNKKYGGSTPCIEVKDNDNRLILDAGTGILNIDFDFYFKASRIDILLTHLHMDHIQGLGFFKPLFIPNKEIHIWGPGGTSSSLKSKLNRFLSPPIFPLPLRDIPSNLTIHEIGNSDFSIGPFKIKSRFVIHPGPTVGYRIEKDKNSLVYLPDHEPMIGSKKLYKENKWISGYFLSKDADILIHDAQYTDEEYQKKIGWGHSSTSHILELAQRANIKNLFMFHHDPEHSDEKLSEMLRNSKDKCDKDIKIRVATQGKSYNVK
jgi:phosphoribosyl 1,2-cyclic phosphodiesterase